MESANEKQLFHGTSKHSVGAFVNKTLIGVFQSKMEMIMAEEFTSQKMPQIANITQNQVSIIIAACFWPGYWLVRTPPAHVVTVDRHQNTMSIRRVICTIRA